MTMTTSQETMTEAARRGQAAIASALQIWTDSVQRFVPVSDTRLSGAVEAVDTMFDFAEQMLVTQREFTKSLLAATTSAATRAAAATQDAAREVKDAARTCRMAPTAARWAGAQGRFRLRRP
jgi:hypothetical protein